MDNQRNLQRNWTNYFPQEKSMEEVRQSLMLTMELEDTRLKVQQELKMRDQQIAQLKDLLDRALKERDRAKENCHKAILDKLMLQQQIHQSRQNSGISSIEDDGHPRLGLDGFSSSDYDESIVSSPRHPPPPPHPGSAADLPLAPDGLLPEKGKLLQAVMKAGPLLQTLLLAGTLPQWRHPPPPLETYRIPPPPVVVTSSEDPFHGVLSFNNCGMIMSSNNRKRGFCEGAESSSMGLKYQRVALH